MKEIDTCDEVTVYYNISKEEYLSLLVKSKFVVVPLRNDFSSCGQVSILEAMSLGKPVIVAKVAGSIDYIEDGRSGLFYEKGNYMDLRKKIILLSENRELRTALAEEALSEIKNTYNHEVFSTRYYHFINEKWQGIGH